MQSLEGLKINGKHSFGEKEAFFWGKGGHQVGVLSTFILQYDQYPIIFKCV